MALVSRHASKGRRGRGLGLLTVWLFVGHLATGYLIAAALTEYEVKAGFLYHFGWFVEWPAPTVQSRAPIFIIGMLGANPFDAVLEAVMQGKTIHERPVVIEHYQRAEDAVSSHILFISASEKSRLASILAVLGQASVLTVSEMEDFAERGGMIALRTVGRKVYFDINVDAAERVGLQLSSKLLKLAKVIHGTSRGRE